MGSVKPKWFYEGYVVLRDKDRVFHKVPVCIPVEEWMNVNELWLEDGNRILEINVRRERNL